jgi:fucose 4-O-acetylase-like acetyltransferase
MSTITTAAVRPSVTGSTRDPFIDLLRTGAILVVVFGHWIMPVLSWNRGTLSAGNSLATPGWWLLTWVAQVMPVFFFAGGAANHHSYEAELRRGGGATSWLTARVRRLAVPVLPLLAVWLVVPSTLRGFGVPAQSVALAAGIVGQLLWFLAVYLLTVAATPLMHAASRRFGLAVPVVLGVGALGVDVLRFHGLPLAGFANELLVWLAVQQLGLAYAAGKLDRVTRAGAITLGCAGFAGTALLVMFGPYPASMVGLPGQAVSNMSPATLCLLTLGVGQIGVLLALRDRLVALASRPVPAKVLRVVSPRCMTVYLWHMSAMVVVAGVAVLGFGYATPAPDSLAWLLVTPLWLGTLALVLRPLVRGFGRFEAVRMTGGRTPSGRRLAAAVVLLCAGLTGIAAFGFADPLRAAPWVAAILAGIGLTWPGASAWLGEQGTRLLGSLVDITFGRNPKRGNEIR